MILAVYNSIFNMTEKINKFELYTGVFENYGNETVVFDDMLLKTRKQN